MRESTELFYAQIREDRKDNFCRKGSHSDYKNTDEEMVFGYDDRIKICRKGKTIAMYNSLSELINDLGRCKNG